MQPKAYGAMLGRVRRGVELLKPALKENDTRLALRDRSDRGKTGPRLQRLLKRYVRALKQRRNTEELTSALFVAHSVEQMGDALLNISESIISANLGQPVNLERYHSLQASVETLDTDDDFVDVQVQNGSRIPVQAAPSPPSARQTARTTPMSRSSRMARKASSKRNARAWRAGMTSTPAWHPRSFRTKRRGQSAALLIEHLPGLTFEQILLNESAGLLKETLGQLGKTLQIRVARDKHRNNRYPPTSCSSCEKRLDDVYKIHPEFRAGSEQGLWARHRFVRFTGETGR